MSFRKMPWKLTFPIKIIWIATQSQYINFLIFSDADLERLYEQWEEDEEPLPVDELPEWDPRKPQPQVSRSQADISTIVLDEEMQDTEI